MWGGKKGFFPFNPAEISTAMESGIRDAPCNTRVTRSEQQVRKSSSVSFDQRRACVSTSESRVFLHLQYPGNPNTTSFPH